MKTMRSRLYFSQKFPAESIEKTIIAKNALSGYSRVLTTKIMICSRKEFGGLL